MSFQGFGMLTPTFSVPDTLFRRHICSGRLFAGMTAKRAAQWLRAAALMILGVTRQAGVVAQAASTASS